MRARLSPTRTAPTSRPRRTGWVAACAAGLSLGCAGGSGGGADPGGGKVVDARRFPSREQLEKLAATPAPAGIAALDVRFVETWELAGPFPERVAVEPWSDPGSPWSSLLDEAARGRPGLVVPTRAMHCVARELGRFTLARRGQPTASLRQFIVSRCNASVARIGFQYVEGEAPESIGDDALFGHWKEAVSDSIRQGLRGGPQTVGIWFGRDGGRAIAMVAFGQRELHLEPVSPFPTGEGVIELRGESLGPAEDVHGLVNRGRFGVRECEKVGGVALPGFHLRCPVDPEDEQAIVSVGIRAPGRLLGRAGLLLLAWPGGRATATYRRPIYGESSPLEQGLDFGTGFAELLNRVRAQAGLPAVALDPGQSEIATELAPHFFASIYGLTDELDAEVVVLGMLAGWTVDGIVQSGHFASAWSLRTTDLADLLASALENPAGRRALLAPEVERIAIGPAVSAEAGREWMAAVFGTYALFSEADHDAMARRVIETLDAERERHGVGPTRRISDVASLCQRAASSVQAGVEPRDALDVLLSQSLALLQRSVAGWIVEVSEIDGLEFPEEYLRRPGLDVAVAVSHRRPEGDPWGRYVVMLVIADPESHGV